MTAIVTPDTAVSQQGHYAGAVSRFSAFVVDITVAGIIYSLGVTFTRFVVETITRHDIQPDQHRLVMLVVYGSWLFLWFTYPWALSGKSFGMAILGIRVVAADGAPLNSVGRSALRALLLPLGFITFGITFLGIIFGREHRAFHDRVAGTAVVYDWDARAARYRFLAKETLQP
jgi:uncharacterized RDD family membrane protein YckC